MKRLIPFLLISGLLLACHSKNKGSKDNGVISFQDFQQRFPDFVLPLPYNQDSLELREPDSLALDQKLLGSYIPDSLWHPDGKRVPRASLFPVAKGTYKGLRLLLVKVVNPASRRVELLIYAKVDTPVAVKEVALYDKKHPAQVFSFQIDRQHLIRINERKELGNGQVIIREQVFGINDDGSTELILTNTNQPASSGSFYNPIDTLATKNRYSGDYYSGNNDLVSIRDGGKEGSFRFFVHLDKEGGDCTGELEGTGQFISKTTADFHERDGPCAVRFSFTSTRVTIKETGGCGAYRGISCYFSGTYKKKKPATTK